MTLSEINEKLTRLVGESTTQYTNAQRAVDLTIALDTVASMILDSQDDYDYDDPNHGSVAIISKSLVADTRTYNFTVSDGVTQFKDVEITYDGTTYYKASRLDRSLMPSPIGNDALIDTNFSFQEPAYDIFGNNVVIYPRPTASVGTLKVWVSREVTPITSAEITTGTKVIGIDRGFHYLVLLLTVRQRYLERNIMGTKLDRVNRQIEEYEQRLRRQYGRKQIDGNMDMGSAYTLTDFE